MPCLLAVLALLAPRVVVALVWFFSTWFQGLFPTPLWPILGFLFLPTTLLWYSAVQHWYGGQWTAGPIIGLVIALLIDVSPASRAGRGSRRD
jgi:hypothetical protein